MAENVPLDTYTVTENVPPAGYNADPNPQMAYVTSSSTITLQFTNTLKPGSIEIKKVDEENNLLGGATFKIEPNPYDGAELLVTDNGAEDADPTEGIILLENVPLGTYTVTENAAPAGYEADPNPQIAEVDPGATDTLQFTNTLKLGVLEVTVVVDWNGVPPDNTKMFDIIIAGPSYPDNDGKSSLEEYLGSTDPCVYESFDTDGDGIDDDIEDDYCTETLLPDTDGDGLCDGSQTVGG